MTINFARVKDYLDAIAESAVGDITVSPHHAFWQTDYPTFKTGNVPGVTCPRVRGNPIPNLDNADLTQSAFYTILTQAAGFCAMEQMPAGGPFINSAGYEVILPDHSKVTGAQIQADVLDWLQSGAPEF